MKDQVESDVALADDPPCWDIKAWSRIAVLIHMLTLSCPTRRAEEAKGLMST